MLIKFPILITEDLLEIAIYLVFLKGCWTKELHSNYCSCQCIVFMTWRKKVWKNFLHFCLQAIQAINGQTNMTAEEFTNMIFQKIDVNNDGKNLGFLGIGSVYPAMRECRIRKGAEHTTEELKIWMYILSNVQWNVNQLPLLT